MYIKAATNLDGSFMARENKASVPAVISNQEILAEINLISQIQQIETRLATEPDSIRFAQLADAYLGIGDFEHAIKLCEQGLKTHPRYDTGTLVLAKSYYLSGNKQKAREVLKEFLVTHPASLPGHKLLGDLSLEEDDVAGTVSHYRIALRFDPINRQIIQTLVDLKDKYQKIKESKSEEEEEEEIKTVPKKMEPKVIRPEKPVEKIQPIVEETPAVKSAAAKEDSKLDSFIEDAIQPDEDLISFKPAEIKPVKQEPVIARTEEKPVADKKSGDFAPAYTDENGIMYFYDDDEVSFDQYKQRLDLQKAGKALILERALLDQKLAEKGVKSTSKVQPSVTEDKMAPSETAFEMDASLRGFEVETPKARKEEKTKPVQSFEEHIDQSMAQEEEDLLSAAEQEAALSEIEISYKDYLDILTSEEELLEALFQEEHEAGLVEEKEDKAARILKSALGHEELQDTSEEAEQPITYLDYVQSLENESDIHEAGFFASDDEKEEAIGLTAFSSYLEESDESIDFATYSLLLETEGVSPDELWKEAKDEEPVIPYKDYLASVPDAEKNEALFEIEKPAVVTPVETKTVETVHEEVKITELPAEAPAVKAEKTEIKETKPIEQPAAIAEAADDTDEYEEEFIEEEINPQDATPELVEKLAARGQYGSAYKVCKMLKVKNPTDAKVDRKILELKRLYVWSSQMVG